MASITPPSQRAKEDSLSSFLRDIRKFPMLAAQEELELARRWRNNGDTAAANKMVTSYLRLVTKIAMGYRGYGLPVSELVSEGNVGMMQAVQRFDPERGFRLSTYAMWWIRASIQEYILHSWSLVKIGTTASQKKLFFNLRTLKNKLQAIDEGQLRPENVRIIAEQLNVPEKDVISMNQRMAGPDHSLNTPLNAESDGEWMDWLVDEGEDIENNFAEREELDNRRTLLQKGMSSLNERERDILTNRRLKETPLTLEELSQHYGISRERVRQVEVRAYEKLKKSVKNLGIEERIATF
ncbi:MAG: RNA polymerase sigma factor RpoH [Rhodospirillaceae bacterium]|jgi:RNA polymerase sigma-32 factor|nr:RNA polymerase sigma factor RpoH [Rhodospirillaceae bacterium]MBT5659944.1 RNA polymerase sigma factor RpoH [Rhodospirillaceae bacterium]MBT5751110.1 RNA polymerase sigma factor RpoH [Rhodospirillaceae bacterium]